MYEVQPSYMGIGWNDYNCNGVLKSICKLTAMALFDNKRLKLIREKFAFNKEFSVTLRDKNSATKGQMS